MMQGGLLASGVTNLIFNLYSTSNTGGRMDDPFDGINPYTSSDDTLAAAFESPLILELDVIGTVIPEPSTWVLLSVALVGLLAWRRRR